MSDFFNENSEVIIFDLKQSIDGICEKYSDHSLLNCIGYAGKEYGVMQRDELEAIMETLLNLKKLVDSLFEKSLAIPPQFRSDANAVPKPFEHRRISLIEMLEAIETRLD